MTHSSHFVKVPLDPEIDRTFHILRRITNNLEQEKIEIMTKKSL